MQAVQQDRGNLVWKSIYIINHEYDKSQDPKNQIFPREENSMVVLGIVLFIAMGVGFVFLYKWGDEAGDGIHTLAMIVSVIMLIIQVIVFIVGICIGFSYIGSGTKAELLNKTYGTNYTAKEVFFAEDIIEEIRRVQRTRIEIEGLK